jgi:hypothetical protein
LLPHRCSKCQARVSLRIEKGRTWQDRARLPKCQRCGAKHYYLDKWRIKVETKKSKCMCQGYNFPHARARGYCYENPLAANLWSERFDKVMECA